MTSLSKEGGSAGSWGEGVDKKTVCRKRKGEQEHSYGLFQKICTGPVKVQFKPSHTN
jgi:hypothetical protein